MSSQAWRDSNQEKLKAYRREHYHRNRAYYIAQVEEYKRTHKTKICKTCGEEKPASEYRTKIQNARTYLRYECNICDNRRMRYSIVSEAVDGRRKLDRKDPRQRAKWLLQDCRKSDKKFNRENDLDILFVSESISHGCFYCGDTTNLMTLDRIDNSRGHLKSNVNPACFRCNDLRSDMPYEAWRFIVPAIKEASEKGIFGKWNNRMIN
jgi:hypothetical protein